MGGGITGEAGTAPREPERPVLRWHGGKWRLAPWIISYFGAHKTYVEPFGGAASVLIRKPRSYAEIYNDLDAEVVSLFRVLRSDQAPRLVEALRLTPFAREEFLEAYVLSDDPVERARQLVIRSFMGFGSDGHNINRGRTGFRANSTRSGTTPAHDWRNYPDCLVDIVERLRGVIIESRHAIDVMRSHDALATLHYVDPPYVHSTRSTRGSSKNGAPSAYAHEMSDEEHVVLLDALDALEGMVILSGYPAPLYDDRLAHWHRIKREAHADGARPRVEVLWLNPPAEKAWRAHGIFA